jgi:hypothetical protein
MPRLLILIPLVVLLLAGAGLAGTWLWAANALQDGYTQWLAERRAEGYRFENATGQIKGFPLSLRARLQEPAVDAPQGWGWQGPTVHAEADLLDPFTVRVRAPGRHDLTTVAGRQLTAEAERARGRVLFRPEGGARSGQITLESVELRGLPTGATTAEALFAALGPRRAPADGPAELDYALETDGLALPEGVETPLDRRLDHLRLRGTLLGPIPPSITANSLRAWRAAGGALQIDHLQLDWAPLALEGDGRLTLDSQLRPQGELQLSVAGLGKTLDRFAEAGHLDPQVVSYAKLAIGALGRTGADGRTRIELPVRFRAGRLYLGPVPLLPLRPVL